MSMFDPTDLPLTDKEAQEMAADLPEYMGRKECGVDADFGYSGRSFDEAAWAQGYDY